MEKIAFLYLILSHDSLRFKKTLYLIYIEEAHLNLILYIQNSYFIKY